jgi:hypothetical protein
MLFTDLSAMVSQFFGNLSGTASSLVPQVFFFLMEVCFFGLYFTRLWVMISAVDVAAAQWQRSGRPPRRALRGRWQLANLYICQKNTPFFES